MTYRAENIPKDVKRNASGTKGKSNGFTEDGNYGKKEVDDLTKRMRKKLIKRFKKTDWIIVDEIKPEPEYVLQVMILDARNDRPTMQQSKGHSSISDGAKPGGATIVGRLTLVSDASKFKTFTYSNYTSRPQSMTWGTAHHTFDHFAKRVSQEISKNKLVLDGEGESL